MNYTVVGLFPDNETAQKASDRLAKADFPKESYNVSNYKVQDDDVVSDADDTVYDYEEDKDTRSFWDRLFGTDDDNEEARYNRSAYSRAGSRSNIVTVYTDDRSRAEEAREIMDDAGAISVDDHLPETGYAGTRANYVKDDVELDDDRVYDRDVDMNRTVDTNLDKDSQNIEVVKEDINVGKKEVSTGGVKIRSRIVERPVEEDVRLREERVYIRRNPVNREVRNADNAFQDASIEMNQSKEVPVVEKTARVVEEISVGKDVDERVETVKDKVRETEVDIEDNTDSKILNKDRDNDINL